MEFRILGPLEVRTERGVLQVPGAKPRAILAVLLLHPNETVSSERLALALWGEDAPAGATKTVQVNVSRLRKALGGADVIETMSSGYRVRVRPGELDAERFERLAEDGRIALEDGHPRRAASLLREALALWRGPPLADLADEPFAPPEIARLDEQRLAATEVRVEAELAAGAHAQLVGELQQLASANPRRERLHGQLMLALYRAGRQADALEVYRSVRERLVEELGVEPGRELRRLHDAVLHQDPVLEPGPVGGELPPELSGAAASPIAGRTAELARLLDLRQAARRAQAGALVLLVGRRGIGKTRLAAEFAREAHRLGDAVLYAGPDRLGPAAATLDARHPTVLVVDDVDRAPAADRDALAALEAQPIFVVVTAEHVPDRLQPLASLSLSELSLEHVAEIAEQYAGHDRADVPVSRLFAVSGGLPARVHELAGRWARGAAVRRLGVAVAQATSERHHLRAVERRLTDNVVDLRLAHTRAEHLAGRAPQPGVCPFKGLAAFDFDDAAYFFGRERLVAELVARMIGNRVLGIVGASGSGKSSVLRAGVLPALAEGSLPGSEAWARVLMRPGAHPHAELERALAGQRGRIVLAVDQFEETFAACEDERERQAFIEALLALTRSDGTVLLTLRADYYERCSAYPEFAGLLAANHLLVGPMRRDELRRAIEGPAERAGLAVEPDLVDRLRHDVESQPGGLPLLAVALLQLWQHRDDNCLRLPAYEHLGGVHGAVARLGEEAFAALDAEGQATARCVLLRLAGPGDGDRVVRRQVALAAFDAREAHVIDELAERRLVTVSAGVVEVAHEALFREWPRLRGWLEEDVEARRVHGHLAFAARAWDRRGRDASDLYRAARLSAALEWREGHARELDETEHAFLDAGRALATRSTRRMRAGLAAVSALLAVAVAAGLVALDQRRSARDEARAADAQRLGVMALAERRLDRAVLLAREGVALDDSPVARGNLLAALARMPAAIAVAYGDGDRLSAIEIDPAGRRLAIADHNGHVRLRDAASGRRRRTHETPSSPRTLRFSPDGSRLAIHGGHLVEVLDARTGRLIAQDETTGASASDAPRSHLAFSRDSRVLVAATTCGDGNDLEVARLDARTGAELDEPRVVDGLGPLAVFAGGSRVLASERDGVAILDTATLATLERFPVRAVAAAVSDDGRTLALGTARGAVHFVDVASGATRTAPGGHERAVVDARFAAGGELLVTVGADARLIVWDAARARATESIALPDEAVGVAIAPDGRTAYGASADGAVFTFALTGERRLGRPVDTGATLAAAAVAADGSVYARVPDDGSVEIVETRGFKVVQRLALEAVAVAVAPHARAIAVASAEARDGRTYWDELRPSLWVPGSDRVHGFARRLRWPFTFSADGRRLAARGPAWYAVTAWDLARATRLATIDFSHAPMEIAISPDARTVVAAHSYIEVARIGEPVRPRRLVIAEPHGVRFSGDGRWLVALDREGRVRVFDARTFEPHRRPLGSDAVTMDISPRGDVIAATLRDGSTQLWDVASGEPLGVPLRGFDERPAATAFLDGGDRLLILYNDGRAFEWDPRPQSWKRHACRVAGRGLSRSEWRELFGPRAYAPVCGR